MQAGGPGEPRVESIAWKDGDLEIRFTQAAPCGEWLPVSPRWEVTGRSVVLHYAWLKQYPAMPSATALCTKFVRAWVFNVPQGEYTATFGRDVPRFTVRKGQVQAAK